jgi:hypothetical protein
MIIVKYIDLIENKTLRTTPNVRTTLDLGEVSPKIAGDLHDLRSKGHQALTVILGTNEEMEIVLKAIKQYVHLNKSTEEE